MLRQVREEFGTPILLVTHDLDECFELGDRMLILVDGKVAQEGAPRDVLEAPASVDVARLLGRYCLVAARLAGVSVDGNAHRARRRRVHRSALRWSPCRGRR